MNLRSRVFFHRRRARNLTTRWSCFKGSEPGSTGKGLLKPPRTWIFLGSDELLAQFLNLVARLSRLFKLQLLSVIKHLLFQLNDLLFQITRAQDGTTTVLAFHPLRLSHGQAHGGRLQECP